MQTHSFCVVKFKFFFTVAAITAIAFADVYRFCFQLLNASVHNFSFDPAQLFHAGSSSDGNLSQAQLLVMHFGDGAHVVVLGIIDRGLAHVLEGGGRVAEGFMVEAEVEVGVAEGVLAVALGGFGGVHDRFFRAGAFEERVDFVHGDAAIPRDLDKALARLFGTEAFDSGNAEKMPDSVKERARASERERERACERESARAKEREIESPVKSALVLIFVCSYFLCPVAEMLSTSRLVG